MNFILYCKIRASRQTDSEPFGSSLIVFVVYHQLHLAQDTVILAVSLAAARDKPHADSLHLPHTEFFKLPV